VTPDDDLARDARVIDREARRALAAGDAALPAGSKVLPALAVRTLEGALQGWFVPVVAGDRLVAFLRFTLQHVLAGTSTFMRQSKRIDACPLAADWLDTPQIRSRAQALAAPGEHAGEPMLSFDGVPDRFAWAVPLRRAGAAPRWVFVAGTSVWPAQAGSEKP
jgi:hypothetical protein